jgi:hypothetical protein
MSLPPASISLRPKDDKGGSGYAADVGKEIGGAAADR